MIFNPTRYAWMVLFANLIVSPAIADAHGVAIERDILPANGRQETIVTIPRFGRYSMITQSEQGTSLRYINKMSGPSALSGKAGERDGRIDTFLDVGEYKLVAYASENGSGNVKLAVQPFTEVNGEVAPQLVENKLLSTQLGDLEQRSYWIHLTSRQTVLIEAAGRSLGDLRLWHEGNWLIDLEPRDETVEPSEGSPLRVKQLSADLNPGLYLLVAYGGPPLPWAQSSNDHPFHLRAGIPRLGANGVDSRVTSPFGYDRWLVSEATDYFRLELEQNSPAKISVARFDNSYAFDRQGRSAEITKDSRLPVAEVLTSKGRKENFKVITISTTAGQAYTFQRFAAVRFHVIDDPGTYWVSTLHSGFGEDSVDATSVLTDTTRSRGKYVDSRAIPLSQNRGWQRRFNVLGSLSLFFEVKQPGTYRVEADGIKGEFLFEPFLTYRSATYKPPPPRDLGETWSLDPGFYELTVLPDHDARGVATLSVYQKGRKPSRPSPARTSSHYKSVKVDWQQRYRLSLNHQPEVVAGILVRKYPLDLADSMPLSLSAGETLTLDVRIPAKGELVARTEDGSEVEYKLKQAGSFGSMQPKPGSKRYVVETGLYDLKITNQSQHTQNYQLYFADAAQLATTPLPAIDESLLQRPDFPMLSADQPHYFDLKTRQWASFNVIVDEPGLYRLESTGLLQTRGNIRTRVITRLDQKANNGIGRNFLIQQFLREGNYQLTLATEGSTEGHLGVQLGKTALVDAGRIEDGIAARYSLPSGEGLIYSFTIAQDGKYRLRSFGTNGYFNARLEDGDGWPLAKPGIRADITLDVHAGDYRLVVLPTALSARVVTLLEKIEEPEEHEGHGPFAMDLNQRNYKHRWMEPAEGNAREPDVWTFELPAPAETSLALSDGMEATVTAVGGEFNATTFNEAKPFKQTLPAGRYRIEARARRKNNRLDYQLDFGLKELVVGQRRWLSLPAYIDLSIGRESLVELSSFGQDDVKAQLFDADDKLLASSDDRANDWNFDIIQSLPAGRYRLAVRGVGKSNAQTMIRMSEPKTLAATPLALPAKFSVSSPLIHNYDLDLSAQSGVFTVVAESRDSVSLTLEKRSANGTWSSIGTANGSNALLLVAIDNSAATGSNYRLKIWSPEQRGAEIQVHTGLLQSRSTDEASVTRGLDLGAQTWLAQRLAAANIGLPSPGMFVTAPELADALFWAADKDTQLQPYDGFISGAQNLWLVSTRPEKQLKATRVLLQDQTLLLNIAASTGAWLDSARSGFAHELVVAEARVGLPGVGVLDANRIDARQMGVGRNSSIVLANAPMNDNGLQLKIWNTEASNSVLPVRVRRHGFEQANEQNLARGSRDATLAKQSTLSFKLDGSLQDLRFNLPRGVAAVLSHKGKTLRSFWADRSDETFQLWSDADRLQLFNTGVIDRVINIKLNAAHSRAKMTQAQMFKQRFASAGTFSLALAEDSRGDSEATVYGSRTEMTVVNASGRVTRGARVPVDGDSVVNLAHGVGLAVAWLNNKQNYAEASDVNREVPPKISLTGSRKTVEFVRSAAGFVNLQSATPVITRLQRSGLPDEVRVFEFGINTSLFFPPGKNKLHLQSIAAQDLRGELYLTAVPEVELEEGLGAAVSMLPGDTRVYRFSLATRQDIGVGVQASVDVARAYLFNQQGDTLGIGITQKHELDQGTYYLMVELPPDAAQGIDMKPAIVGLELPDTGPSKEVMLEYQNYSSPETF